MQFGRSTQSYSKKGGGGPKKPCFGKKKKKKSEVREKKKKKGKKQRRIIVGWKGTDDDLDLAEMTQQSSNYLHITEGWPVPDETPEKMKDRTASYSLSRQERNRGCAPRWHIEVKTDISLRKRQKKRK